MIFLLIFLSFNIDNSYAEPVGWDPANTCRFYPYGLDDNGVNYKFPPGVIKYDTGEDLSGKDALVPVPFTGLTHRLVECVRSVLWKVQGGMLSIVSDNVRNVVIAALTLYLILFGIKLTFQATGNLVGDSMVFVFTFVAVIVFTKYADLKFFIEAFEIAQRSFIDIVSASSSVGGRCNDTLSEGILIPVTATGGSYDFNIWQKIDCTIVTAFGILPMPSDDWLGQYIHVDPFMFDFNEAGENGSAPNIMVMLFYLVGAGGLLWTSKVGILILFVGILAPILMIAAFAQAILVYISSFIAIVFLGLLGPIIIPCVLFSVTKNVFDNWLRFLFGYTIQPAIIFAYLAFMLNVINLFVDGDVDRMDVAFGFGGLRQIYIEVKNDVDADLANTNTRVGLAEFNASAVVAGVKEPCDSVSGSAGGVCGGVYVKGYRFSTLHKQKSTGFLMYLVILVLLFGITLTFMSNVMTFGQQLAGVGVPNAVNFNVYEKAMRKIRNSLNNGK